MPAFCSPAIVLGLLGVPSLCKKEECDWLMDRCGTSSKAKVSFVLSTNRSESDVMWNVAFSTCMHAVRTGWGTKGCFRSACNIFASNVAFVLSFRAMLAMHSTSFSESPPSTPPAVTELKDWLARDCFTNACKPLNPSSPIGKFRKKVEREEGYYQTCAGQKK